MTTTQSHTDTRTEQTISWPSHLDRTPAEDRGSYPGDFEVTRLEAFKTIVTEIEHWGGTEIEVDSASQHYADRPNEPHQHDRPDDPGVVARFRPADAPADDGRAIACDRWETQLENARAIALYAQRMRLGERCEVATAGSTMDTARLPPGDEDGPIAMGPGGEAHTEPHLEDDREPHEVLGVAPDADPSVVTAAARQLKAKYHPDGEDDPDEFRAVVRAEEAFDV